MFRIRFALSFALLACLPCHLLAQAPSTELVLIDTLGQPVQLLAPLGDERLFMAELEGTLRIAEGNGVSSTPYLDLSSQVQLSIWSGLRGAVFHPEYASNGYVYVYYDAPSDQGGANDADAVIDRFTVSANDPNQVDPASRVEIFRAYQPMTFHGGGCLKFGPDGMLYFAIGDGGAGAGDPQCNAQNTQLLNGKMVRIDVDGGFPYTIPADNPFVGQPEVRDEILHIGFRHPWRWSFDSATGDMYISDVGQHDREELNIVPAGTNGLNFGWKIQEGTTCYNNHGCPSDVPSCGSTPYTEPAFEYVTGADCSIIGGYVYRGSAVPQLGGQYVFGDYCTGSVWTLQWEEQGGVANYQDRTDELGGPFLSLTSFGVDGFGELYLLQQTGEVHRFVEGCGTTRLCTPGPNSVGSGAELSSSGEASLSVNAFHLEVTSAPPEQPGLFFYGFDASAVPFGEGTLCIGGTISRLNPPLFADAQGMASRHLDFGSAPANGGPGQIHPGQAVRFQFWYRDPAGGGTGFNLSDGLSAVFCP